MKYNMKKLLCLVLALLMLIPGAMAEEKKFAGFMNAEQAEISIEDMEILAPSEELMMNEMNVSDQLSDETITFMVKNLHWFCALYKDTQNIIKEWCVPVAKSEDGSYLYMVQVGSMVKQLDGAPDGWAVSDLGTENAELANIAYVSDNTDVVLVESKLSPSAGWKGNVENADGMTGYGFLFVEEGGESNITMRTATMEKNDAHYTVPNGTFEVSSPVYAADGKLIGISDGGKNVYSYTGVLNEAMVEEPAEEPVNEPEEEPTAKPTEEPTEAPKAEPVAEPVDEPAEETENEPDPTKKPAEEPTAEPEEEEDEPKAAGKTDDDNKKLMIIGGVAVVAVAAFIWKKRKNGGKKNDNTPNPPSRPTYNGTPSTPKYEPKQDGDVTAPLNDATAPMDSGVGKTVLVSEPTKKRIVVGILCVGGTMNGAKYRLDRETRIGRDPKRCSIIYPENERGISGLHCSVEPTADGGLKLTDLGSSFGTNANGCKLPTNAPCILRAGDRFDLADGYNRFEVFTEEI